MCICRHVVTSCAILLLAGTGFAAGPETSAAELPPPPEKTGRPERVAFGIYVVDIDGISAQDQNFEANFVLILQWKDKRLAHADKDPRILPLKEVWHPEIVLTNRQAGVRMPLPEVVSVKPDGTVTFRQQYVGPLSQRLRLHDFPLDTQTFAIQFAVMGIRADDIELVPAALDDDFKGGGMADVLSLPDWEILRYKAEVRPYQVTKTMTLPGFAFVFVAKRHSRYFLWQAVLPLVLIVMMSWVPFWVDPQKAEMQFGIASSTVLTLIAFRFILASMLPPLPYLTRLDILTIGGTILVFGGFLQVVLTSLLAHGGRIKIARRIDRLCRIVFPVAFAALFVWSFFV